MQETQPISRISNNPSVKDNGAHILYIFNEMERYLDNAAQFIYDGVLQHHIVLIIEADHIQNIMKNHLKGLGINETQLEYVVFTSANEFYLNRDHFDVKGASSRLKRFIQTYMEQGYVVRVWGNVLLTNESSILEDLRMYECSCDDYIIDQKVLTVCAYNGLTTQAYIQNELLKTHTHFMMDDKYCLSPFYDKEHHQYPTVKEFERLKRIERQNKELQNENSQLALENTLVKTKNEAIQQSELKLRTIINELPIPIIIKNKDKIFYFNEVAKEQFSISENHVIKISTLNSFFDEFNNKVDPVFNKVLEHQFIHKNGKKKFYLVKSIEILFENAPAILHSFVDVTKDKENENLIIRSEKMNIAGELAASIAHELRNPLTAIKGFFQVLKDGEDKELYYNIIEDELNRIEQISSELLSLAKPHSENRKNYNIVQIINDVILLLTSQSNMKSIEIVLESFEKDITVYCEHTKIKQVFINLIKNALDAMNDGGRIVIKIKNSLDSIKIQIVDEGCGISEELINKIGEPFYTTKEKGTGIGLMVCYQIIENHGGSIYVNSREGVGTTFTIVLPTI